MCIISQKRRNSILCQWKECQIVSPRVGIEADRECPSWMNNTRYIAKQTKASVLPRPCDRVSSSRQLSGRLLEALAWAPKPFVRGCLRVYFLGTIEFFSFSKDCRSLRWYRVLSLPTPHCLKSVRIIVFLCKQRCGVNNRSGFFFCHIRPSDFLII